MTAREAAERWYAAINAGDEAEIADLLHEDFVAHQGLYDLRNEELRGFRQGYRAGFPNLEIKPTLLHDSADAATFGTVTTGTHREAWLGHPPTHAFFRAAGMDCFRVEAGSIREMWSSFDTESMLRQLGLR